MKEFPRRVLMAVLGVCVAGLAVGFFKYSEMGVDPFQVLANGLHNTILRGWNVSYGNFYSILNALMLVGIFFWNRKKIGLGTIINLFLVGRFADFMQAMLKRWNPDPGMAVRGCALIIGIVIMCFASAIYFTADLGVSTYDAVALTLAERHSKWKFKYIRIVTDLICVVAGGVFAFIGQENVVLKLIGVGTIVTAFFMGPLIAFFNKHVAEPLRYGKKEYSKDKGAVAGA